MGLSSKKQTTNTVTNSNANTLSASTASTTPNVPDWLLAPAQQQAGLIGSIQGQGASAYAPTVSGLQQQAQQAAGALPLTNLGYGQARDVLTNLPQVAHPGAISDISAGHVSAGSVLDGLQNYYTPYRDQVLNPALADFDQQAGQTRAAQAAQAAQGAFRGSRYGVAEAETEGQLARARAATEGGLLSDMFGQATGLSAADKGRTLQADQGNQSADLSASQANLNSALEQARLGQSADQSNQSAALQKAGLLDQIANDKGSTVRANLALQNQIGGEATAQQNAQAQYPLQFAQQTDGLLAGLNPSDYIGKTIDSSGATNAVEDGTSNSTSKSSGGLLSSLGQVAQIAALFA